MSLLIQFEKGRILMTGLFTATMYNLSIKISDYNKNPNQKGFLGTNVWWNSGRYIHYAVVLILQFSLFFYQIGVSKEKTSLIEMSSKIFNSALIFDILFGITNYITASI